MSKKKALLLFCCISCHMVQAQTPDMMPEGSTDINLGMAALIAPSHEGSDKQKFYLLPFASVVWSNGVFLAPGEIGLRLPSPQHLQYGPLLSYELQTNRADRNASSSLVFTPGAYFNYRLDHRLGFRSRLDYGAGTQHQGIRLHLANWFSMPLARHQSLSAEVGLTLANKHYMQSYFGINPEQAQYTGLPAYNATAGIKNTSLQVGWNVELSPKYDFSTRIGINRLWGSAASSPLTTKTNTVSLLTSLTYHY
ncbi:MipA/OmpV family protein [Undibacterium sp. Tian12W]|uniref:MipA/OmpV family protein n=1 Tax=Undibacterium sp. Tian12W TaxID=3413054 RepID=UPI003BF1A5F1